MAAEAEDKLISVREAAKECGRNPETVRRWIWSGKLPAEKLGNQLFVRTSSLTSLCREMAIQQKSEPETDFLQRAIALQIRLKTRGLETTNGAELIRGTREERMSQIEQSLH